MDIGKQIRALRVRRGVTQEAMARRLGVSAQAVSKWERGAAAPDIAMLPELSVYLGVSIDELFSLADDTRMERIQNMLWDTRTLSAAVSPPSGSGWKGAEGYRFARKGRRALPASRHIGDFPGER